jgi:hypothetical protein
LEIKFASEMLLSSLDIHRHDGRRGTEKLMGFMMSPIGLKIPRVNEYRLICKGIEDVL